MSAAFRTTILFALLAISSLSLRAQTLRTFNIGTSTGVSQVHFLFIPTMDFAWKGTTLRVQPLLPVFSMGLTQNILPIAKENNQGYLVASVGYNRYNGNWQLGNTPIYDQDKVSGMAGLRLFFGKRVVAQLQIGGNMIFTRQTDNLALTETGLAQSLELAAELSLGINLWPHYLETAKKEGNQ